MDNDPKIITKTITKKIKTLELDVESAKQILRQHFNMLGAAVEFDIEYEEVELIRLVTETTDFEAS